MTKSFEQSLLDGYFYLMLLLKLFPQKKSILLKLPHVITFLPRLAQSNEIHFAASWWAVIIKGRCITFFKWHFVKYHFDFNCLPLDYKQINYKTSSKGAGKGEIRQWSYFHIVVIFEITWIGTPTTFNPSFTTIKVQIDHQILIKLRTHKVCYEDPGNKNNWFMKNLVY